MWKKHRPISNKMMELMEAFDSINNIDVHTGLITRLMEAMLKHNIFQFNGDLYQQLIRTTMGSCPAPSYCDIYLSK